MFSLKWSLKKNMHVIYLNGIFLPTSLEQTVPTCLIQHLRMLEPFVQPIQLGWIQQFWMTFSNVLSLFSNVECFHLLLFLFGGFQWDRINMIVSGVFKHLLLRMRTIDKQCSCIFQTTFWNKRFPRSYKVSWRYYAFTVI